MASTGSLARLSARPKILFIGTLRDREDVLGSELADKFEVVEVPSTIRALARLTHDDFSGVYVGAEHLNEATLANLRSEGFPVSDKEKVFLGLGTVVEGCEAQGSSKACRRELIGRKYRVLAMVGDQLGDFLDVENNTTEARREAARPYQAWFGERWFMLPNPSYGSWDGAVLGNARGADAAEKHRIRLESLRTE